MSPPRPSKKTVKVEVTSSRDVHVPSALGLPTMYKFSSMNLVLVTHDYNGLLYTITSRKLH